MLYADDKQLYSATTVTNIDTTRERLVNCILDVREWCASRRLQLNSQKAELVWFGSAANIRKMSAKNLTLSVGGDVITPAEETSCQLCYKQLFLSAPPTSSD